MQMQSDEELYKDYLKNKSQNSFKVLYLRYSSPLIRYVYRFTFNQQAADEIIHDIFADLLSGKFECPENANLKNWLYVVAKNKGLNWIERHRKTVHSDAIMDSLVHPQNIERDLIQKNLLDSLRSAEKKLPAEILKTWELRKLGLDNNAIAEQLSIPIGTVKSRFFRLVEIIKKEMTL